MITYCGLRNPAERGFELMNLETIAYLATIASAIVAYLTYLHNVKSDHLKTTQRPQVKQANNPTSESAVNLDKKIEISNSSYKIERKLGVGKTPFFPANTLESILLSILPRAKKRFDLLNCGDYAEEDYRVVDYAIIEDIVYSTCDTYLAIIVWSWRQRKALNIIKADEKSTYTTGFMRLSKNGDHLVFGAGGEVLYSWMGQKPIYLELPSFDYGSTLIVSERYFLFVRDLDHHGSIISMIDLELLPEASFSDIVNIPNGSIKIQELVSSSGRELLLLYPVSFYYEPTSSSVLQIVDCVKKEIVFTKELLGFQCLHIDNKLEKIVVLSSKIEICSYEFEVFATIELEKKWSQTGSWPLGSLSAHPSGEVLAISVFNDGKITFYNSDRFQVIESISTPGHNVKNISWSLSGRYLAYISYNGETEIYKYMVYDYKEKVSILEKKTTKNQRCNKFMEWIQNDRGYDTLVILQDSVVLEWIEFSYY